MVEDEPVVRGVILEMLGRAGLPDAGGRRRTVGPENPAQPTQRIDLLVTDVGLPGMNGRQLADQARETRPGLKMLFITGYAESVAMADGFLQPGMEMITKPFDLDHLGAAHPRDDFGVACSIAAVSPINSIGVTVTSPPATCRVFSV